MITRTQKTTKATLFLFRLVILMRRSTPKITGIQLVSVSGVSAAIVAEAYPAVFPLATTSSEHFSVIALATAKQIPDATPNNPKKCPTRL